MYYLTSLVLSTAVLSFLLETNTRLSVLLLLQLLLLLLFSRTAIQCQIYCSTKPFSCRFSFSSLRNSTSLERLVVSTYFFLSNCMGNYTTIFPPISHAYFFHDYNTQNLFWNLKSSLNSFHMHDQPLQYPQQLHAAERPESHRVCNFLKAEGVYCYGFYLGL